MRVDLVAWASQLLLIYGNQLIDGLSIAKLRFIYFFGRIVMLAYDFWLWEFPC